MGRINSNDRRQGTAWVQETYWNFGKPVVSFWEQGQRRFRNWAQR